MGEESKLLTWEGKSLCIAKGCVLWIAKFIIETHIVREVVNVAAIQVLSWTWFVLIALLLNDCKDKVD